MLVIQRLVGILGQVLVFVLLLVVFNLLNSVCGKGSEPQLHTVTGGESGLQSSSYKRHVLQLLGFNGVGAVIV